MTAEASGVDAPDVDRAFVRRALFNVLLGARLVDPARLAASLGCSVETVDGGLEDLGDLLAELGLRLEPGEKGLRLERTAEMEDLLERYRGGGLLREETHLTLALLARLGTATMPEIATIRRVETVRDAFETLLEQGLVEESGRRPGRGRPFVYQLTPAGHRLLQLRPRGGSPPAATSETAEEEPR